jgi:1-phosphatidylinositol-3-phosphate 5-kinase
MTHLRIMLRQMLTIENIPNAGEWEETLLKLALRIAKDLTFTAFPQRQGQDMDVRRYVKIKKIPGGAPKDSEYVDGAVITKNVAHKQMTRSHRNPRVMLVTFPLEFHRVENQYMPFSQIMRQEKEYLGNLATRIAAVRPHVILAERSVSGIALEELTKHNIAVARSVKTSAIQLVSRVTQADIVSSMDRLLEPRFGHCQRFRIQTFDHPLIPGRRKTYMRFEGCNPSMGCTILLRGGNTDTLTRIKRITRLLAFIVRNLKLETHLWKDSIISVPILSLGAAPQAYIDTLAIQVTEGGSKLSLQQNATTEHSRQPSASSSRSRTGGSGTTAWGTESEAMPDEQAELDRLSRRIQTSLEPYLNTFISASATLRFPPPQPLRRMKELDDMLYRDKRAWEDEIIAREEQRRPGHIQEATLTPGLYSASGTSDSGSASSVSTALPTPVLPRASVIPPEIRSMEADIKALIESLPAPNVAVTPSSDGSFESESYFDRPLVASPQAPTTPVEDVTLHFKTMDDILCESKLSQTRWLHAEQRRVWEWYLRKNKDDFVIEKYQRITLWEGRMPVAEYGHHPMCTTPTMKYITFYGDNDCTLGKFIEKSVHDTLVQFLDPKAICGAPQCGQPMARHCTVYLHNETRLFVAVEQWDGQATNVLPPDMISTWSICRICGTATPFIPVSEEMQRYSFAKFLELHFYPADVNLVQGAGCHHNIYQDHVRYFAWRNMTVRFQADPIVLHEVIYPPRHIRVRPDALLALKNSDYERLLSKYISWYNELVDELQFISIDATTGNEDADSRLNTHINMLITKGELERGEFQRMLNKVYNESSPYDTLALNQVRAHRQDKLVAWQEEFDKLPRVRASVTERGSRRTSAFSTMRGIFPRRDYPGVDYHGNSSSVSDVDDITLVRKAVPGSASSVGSGSAANSKATSPTVPEMSTTATEVATSSTSTTENAPSSSTESAPEKPLQGLEVAADGDEDSDSTISALRTITRAPQLIEPDEPASETVSLFYFGLLRLLILAPGSACITTGSPTLKVASSDHSIS